VVVVVPVSLLATVGTVSAGGVKNPFEHVFFARVTTVSTASAIGAVYVVGEAVPLVLNVMVWLAAWPVPGVSVTSFAPARRRGKRLDELCARAASVQQIDIHGVEGVGFRKSVNR